MIKTLLLLTVLALVQARPSDDVEPTNARRYEFHEDCPPSEVHFLLPHEYDCTKFYYCEYGMKWIEPRSCAPGTEFSAAIQVCVHPINSGCTLPGFSTTPASETTSTAGTIAPTAGTTAPPTIAPTPEPTVPAVTTPEPTTPEVITQTTPQVTTPAPTTPEVATPEPTTPDVITQTTPQVTTPEPTTPEVATPEPTTPEVVTQTTPQVTTAGPTTPEVATPVPTIGTTELPSDTESPVNPTAAPTAAPSTSAPVSTVDPDDCETLANGCPADFSIHKLLPHEEYCHMFYYCDKGELVLRYCAPGTYFNPKLQVCDWPHNVDCVNDGSYEYPTTSAPTTQPPSPPGGGDNDIGEILDNGCPADFDVHHLLPHETECNKFYYCVFGQKVERSCAPGTYFNYEIQVCDWPFNVNCVSTGTTPGGATDDTSSSEEIPIPSDPETPEDPIEWVPLPNGCPADFTIHHLLPHESDCGKFYYCVHGQILMRDCPAGTHFSPSQQICDWPQNAGCEHWNGGCSGSGNDNGGCTSTSTTAAPGGNDGTTAAPGGNDGTTAAPGGNDGTTAAPGGNDGTTAAPGGNDGTTAAPGGNDGTTAAPGGNDGTTAAGTTPGGVTDDTSSSEEISIPSDPETPEDPIGWVPLPNGCPADFTIHHLLPHESDCGKFYYCVHGQTLVRDCPAGTHFSPSQQICDWPQNAGCEHWDSGCSGPGGCAGTTAAPGGNDGTTAAPGGNDGTTAAPGGNDGTTAAPGGNDGTTAAPGGNDGTTAAPGGNDGTTAAPGGNDGTTAAPGGNDGTTAAPGDNDGTTAAPGGNDGTTAAPGGNDGTTAAPGGNDGTTAAPGDNDGTTAAPGGNDGTTAAPGGNDGTTAAPGGNDGTTAAPGGNDGTTAAPGGNDGTTAAPGGNDGTTAAPGDNDGTTAAPGGNDGTTAAPGDNDGTTAAPGCEICQPITPEDRCKSGCNVLPFVHDNDCDKYWMCNGEQPLLVTCSEGLHFNPSTYTCDFICNAGCLRENVQITTIAEGVKVFLPWGSITSEMMNLLDAELNADL